MSLGGQNINLNRKKMTKNIEMTLLYENGYGKLWINKEYHVVDFETEDPKGFLENLAQVLEILGDEVTHDKDFVQDFIQAQTASLAIQDCEVIHKHLMAWDPAMAAVEMLAKQSGIDTNNPLELAKFAFKTLSQM